MSDNAELVKSASKFVFKAAVQSALETVAAFFLIAAIGTIVQKRQDRKKK